MSPALLRWFFAPITLGAVTVDFDSAVITREGSQTRTVANTWLRPGNTAACSNRVEFMRETFDEALAGVKVGLVRATAAATPTTS